MGKDSRDNQLSGAIRGEDWELADSFGSDFRLRITEKSHIEGKNVLVNLLSSEMLSDLCSILSNGKS